MTFHNKIRYFFCPHFKEYERICNDMPDISSLSGISDPQELNRKIIDATRHVERMRKASSDFQYKLTSNKVNIFFWGYWWLNATFCSMSLYNSFSVTTTFTVMLDLFMIVYVGTTILTNDKKRDELFVDAI
mgnify:FL=1